MTADDHQLLVVELQVVQIVPAQFGRQEPPAEGRLVKALRSDKQRDDAVAKLAVVAHPLRHHAIEPHPEPLFPLLQVGLHPILWRTRQILWGGRTDANPKLLPNDT